MVVPGNAFRTRAYPNHVWIVLTHPDENGEVLIANLSTLTERTEDVSCVLGHDDYACFIVKPTFVVYQRTKQVIPSKLLDSQCFQKMSDVPAETMQKILDGALQSDQMRQRYQEIIRRTMDNGAESGLPEISP